jgi:hypothetical protein
MTSCRKPTRVPRLGFSVSGIEILEENQAELPSPSASVARSGSLQIGVLDNLGSPSDQVGRYSPEIEPHALRSARPALCGGTAHNRIPTAIANNPHRHPLARGVPTLFVPISLETF